MSQDVCFVAAEYVVTLVSNCNVFMDQQHPPKTCVYVIVIVVVIVVVVVCVCMCVCVVKICTIHVAWEGGFPTIHLRDKRILIFNVRYL